MKKHLPILFIVLSLLIGAFAFHMYQERWRTDLEPLIKFFPVFSDAEECCWKSGNNNSLFSAPGPSSVWIKGYIRLAAASLKRLRQNYSWEQAECQPYQIEGCPGYPLNNAQWLLSQELSTEVMMPQFVGWIYINEQSNAVYIYAEFA